MTIAEERFMKHYNLMKENSEKAQRILAMADAGYSAKEIADALGMPESTVRVLHKQGQLEKDLERS